LTVLDAPLLNQEIFAVVNREVHQRHAARVQAWWDALGQMHNMAPYRSRGPDQP
jgi:hypothetical protein